MGKEHTKKIFHSLNTIVNHETDSVIDFMRKINEYVHHKDPEILHSAYKVFRFNMQGADMSQDPFDIATFCEYGAKVSEHIDRNGFTWRYAISPADVTETLVDDFGINIVNPPSAPMILICEDFNTKFLERGVKDVDRLKEIISEGC